MEKKKISRDTIYAVLTWSVIFIIFYLLVFGLPFSEKADRTKCPYKIEGNPKADFVIKYIDSPYCIWCWLQEPVLKKLVKTKGDSFRLERYDIKYCTDIVKKYRFSGTPSFVFSVENGTKEYTHWGYINKKDFFNIICETTRNC